MQQAPGFARGEPAPCLLFSATEGPTWQDTLHHPCEAPTPKATLALGPVVSWVRRPRMHSGGAEEAGPPPEQPRCSLPPPEERTLQDSRARTLLCPQPHDSHSQCPRPPGLQQRLPYRSHPDLQTPAPGIAPASLCPLVPASPPSSSFIRHKVSSANGNHSTKTLGLHRPEPRFRALPGQCWGSFQYCHLGRAGEAQSAGRTGLTREAWTVF